MTIAEFKTTDPEGLRASLRALWWDAQGNWDRAHEIAQDVDNAEGAWVHAYLHRKEGDLSNAGYWYRRAGQQAARGDLEAEWSRIVEALLG
jgi:hypothetical protein